jgi:tRNA(Ile)-lysidine synthase
VRADALPALIAALGPAVVDNLARTAAQSAVDNAALDELAVAALAAVRVPGAGPASVGCAAVGPEQAERARHAPADVGLAAVGPAADGLAVGGLVGLPGAVRTRVLHMWARELGAPGGALSHRHVAALDALVTDWHGQGPTQLPGDISVARRDGILVRIDRPDM